MKNRIAVLFIAVMAVITATACSDTKNVSNDKVLERIKYVGEHHSKNYARNCKANVGTEVISHYTHGGYCGFGEDYADTPVYVNAEDYVNTVSFGPYLLKGIENSDINYTDNISLFKFKDKQYSDEACKVAIDDIFSGFEYSNKAYAYEYEFYASDLINYFDYDYKEPDGDAIFNIDTEIIDCPWWENEYRKVLKIGIKAKDNGTEDAVYLVNRVEVEFNSKEVTNYQLIGYSWAIDENDSDIEVHSGQEMTAIYEVTFRSPDRQDESIIENKMNFGDNDLCFINIIGHNVDSEEITETQYMVTKDSYTDNPTPDTIWATGVAQYGNTMIESSKSNKLGNYVDNYERIFNRLKSDPRIMTDDSRAEFCYILGVQGGVIERPIE